MQSIVSNTFGRLVRAYHPVQVLHLSYRSIAAPLLAMIGMALGACGTLQPLEQPDDDRNRATAALVHSLEPAEEAAQEPAMPAALAVPDAGMSPPPDMQGTRRLARRGQPLPAPDAGRDGPGVRAPAELLAVPDAIPRHEPLHPSANRPYSLSGRQFTPNTTRAPLAQSGTASWYGSYFHGRRTATGEIYDMYAMSAAHPTMALPSYARVTNAASGISVVVRVNDRGPFVGDRIIDLSYAAAVRLGFAAQGVAAVKVELIRTTPGINDTLASNAALSTATAGVAATESAPAAASNGRASRVAGASENAKDATRKPETRAAAAPATPAKTVVSRQVFVKIGAFRQRLNATRIGERVAKALPAVQKALSITARDDGVLLVQAGPYADRNEAIVVAEALRRELQIEPLIVVQ